MKVGEVRCSELSLNPETPEGPTDSETLFRRHARFVASFLYRLGVRGADLDDAVQEVFLSAHRKGGYKAGAASPTTFLARLALEANLSRRRRQHRWDTARHDEAALAALGTVPSDPSRELARKQAAMRLQAALDAMDPPHRAVFILFELEGESCEAIAAGLAVPVGTVYSRLHAARRAFRASAAREKSPDEGAPGRPMGSGEMAVMLSRGTS
jgi:RNA polymerase sigma-70 factor (ECF subfamily)